MSKEVMLISKPVQMQHNAHVKAWNWYRTFTLPFQKFLTEDLPDLVNKTNRSLRHIQTEKADLKKLEESGKKMSEKLKNISLFRSRR